MTSKDQPDLSMQLRGGDIRIQQAVGKCISSVIKVLPHPPGSGAKVLT